MPGEAAAGSAHLVVLYFIVMESGTFDMAAPACSAARIELAAALRIDG